MKFVPTIFLFAFLLVGQMFVACSADDNQSNETPNVNSNKAVNSSVSNENSNVPKDNTEEFEMIVALPAHPEEVLWREEPIGAQGNASAANGKKLVAVIKFAAADAGRIAAQAETVKPPAQTLIETESWFPAELIAQSELSGDETLKGTAYAANAFFQPPYNDGKLTRLEDSNYFILELSAR